MHFLTLVINWALSFIVIELLNFFIRQNPMTSQESTGINSVILKQSLLNLLFLVPTGDCNRHIFICVACKLENCKCTHPLWLFSKLHSSTTRAGKVQLAVCTPFQSVWTDVAIFCHFANLYMFFYLFIYLDANMAENWFLQMSNASNA